MEASHGLTLGIDQAVPDAVSLDRDKVGWAITSLVGSALRHVRAPGGAIDVHVAFDRAAGTLLTDVRDNGPGIPADRLDKLLTRGGWRPGGALALLLVEDIAIAHGGSVVIESRTGPPHPFTRIRVTIPV